MTAAQLLAFNQRSAAVGAALWPAVVLIGGVEYDATLTEPAKLAGDYLPGGEEITGSLVTRIRMALLPVAPAAYQELRWKRPGAPAWNATVWWIEEVTGTPTDAEWRILCSPKN